MSAGKDEGKIKWRVTGGTSDGANQWTSSVERTNRQAVIDFTPPGTYTLTITGTGAPEPVNYATLRLAKNAFRVFLLDKSEV
jgi:hypothetical protein